MVGFCNCKTFLALASTNKRYYHLLKQEGPRKQRTLQKMKDLILSCENDSVEQTLFLAWKSIYLHIMSPEEDNGPSFRIVKNDEMHYIAFGTFRDGALTKIVLRIDINSMEIVKGNFTPEGTGPGFRVSWHETYIGPFQEWHFHGVGKWSQRRRSGVFYDGNFSRGYKQGQGIMTWPDGFTIESDNWFGYSFEDVRNQKIHPKIQEAMDNHICTSTVTDEFHAIPQSLHFCDVYYCFACLEKGCCGCGDTVEDTYWCWGMARGDISCECEREECKIKTKKARLE
eukprot:TRINITY_DN699_c0_g1_i3.p1 TRINITY_DN699_c0_g1~~TRINITY_DN699_c0_g1_i3.p1  ORF type:complete len:300 (-),score=36.90 TRINITY_DN699_c0_g1_i3:75-926(-)